MQRSIALQVVARIARETFVVGVAAATAILPVRAACVVALVALVTIGGARAAAGAVLVGATVDVAAGAAFAVPFF